MIVIQNDSTAVTDVKNFIDGQNKIIVLKSLDQYLKEIETLLKIKEFTTQNILYAEAMCYSFQNFLFGVSVDSVVLYDFDFSFTESNTRANSFTINNKIQYYKVNLADVLKKCAEKNVLDITTQIAQIKNTAEQQEFDTILDNHFNNILRGFTQRTTRMSNNGQTITAAYGLYLTKKSIREKYNNPPNLYQAHYKNRVQLFNMGHIVEAFDRTMLYTNKQINQQINTDNLLSLYKAQKEEFAKQYFTQQLRRDNIITYRQGDNNWTQIKYKYAQLFNGTRARNRLAKIKNLINDMKKRVNQGGPDQKLYSDITTMLNNFLPADEVLVNQLVRKDAQTILNNIGLK